MGLGDLLKSAIGGEDIPQELLDMVKKGNIDLPLAGDKGKMLDDMIGKGVFNSKPDFLSFITKAYMQNNMGSMMSGDKAPPESAIMDVIKNSGIGKGYPEGDIKKTMVPLLATAFLAVHKFMKKSPAVKPA
jgi:hypothetical protein